MISTILDQWKKPREITHDESLYNLQNDEPDFVASQNPRVALQVKFRVQVLQSVVDLGPNPIRKQN